MNYGPSPSLMLLSIKIDTYTKYTAFAAFILIFNVAKVIVDDVSHPTIMMPIYNPDTTIIHDWRRLELQLAANFLSITSALRWLFMIQINMAQMDIALINVLSQELATLFSVRYMLS